MYPSLIYIVLCISQALLSPGQIVKNCQILAPWANSFCQILGAWFPWDHFILINFTLSALLSPGKIVKNCQILAPLGKFFLSHPRGLVSLGPLYSDKFYTFTIFKIPIINSRIEYLQIYKENIDLSMKSM